MNHLMSFLVISLLLLNPVVASSVNMTDGVTAYCENVTTYVVDPFSGECKTYNDSCVPPRSLKVGACPSPQVVERIIEKPVPQQCPDPQIIEKPVEKIVEKIVEKECLKDKPLNLTVHVLSDKFKKENPQYKLWWFTLAVFIVVCFAFYSLWSDHRPLNEEEDFLFQKIYHLMYERIKKDEKIFTKQQLIDKFEGGSMINKGNRWYYTKRRLGYLYDRARRRRLEGDPEARKLFGWW